MSTVNETLAQALEDIGRLCDDTDGLIKSLNDPTNQHAETAQSVGNFVGQVLGHVNGNSDLPTINRVLVDALLEVQRYVGDRPQNIKQSIEQLSARKAAYEDCIRVLQVYFTVEPEPAAESNVTERIMSQLDDDGNFPSRIIGERPEKIKEIRRAQEQLKAGDIREKDI